jgi:pimeloyl-ACP methyl ester carboxylesterase
MSTTKAFESGDVRIEYDDVGSGAPIVLVHGFASNRQNNWQESGWYDALTDTGRRVVALDCRGHGESGKPHDPAAYDRGAMAEDVVRLMDELGIETADLMGYSMGGHISTYLLLEHPERFNTVVLAGVGSTLLGEREHDDTIAEALEADDADDVDDERGLRFRLFAEDQGSDLAALAALQRAPRTPIDEDRLAEVDLPVLVVAGDEEVLVGKPGPLADATAGAEAVAVPGEDHLTTVGDPRYREAVLEFLERDGL